MRGGLALIVAVAAGLAGCGGSLGAPGGGPGDDAGSTTALDGGSPHDAVILIAIDASLPPPPCTLVYPAPPIAGTTCQFTIPQPPDCEIVDRTRFDVFIDGAQVPQLDTDGWTFTDPTQTTIDLHGASCDAANGSTTGVMIEFLIILV